MTDQELLDDLGVDSAELGDGRQIRRHKTPRELVDISIGEISAVDRPANRRRFLIVKREAEAQIQRAEHEAETFDDMMARRRVGHVVSALSEHYGALIDTLTSIANSDERGKAALVRAAIDNYLTSVKGAFLEEVI